MSGYLVALVVRSFDHIALFLVLAGGINGESYQARVGMVLGRNVLVQLGGIWVCIDGGMFVEEVLIGIMVHSDG